MMPQPPKLDAHISTLAVESKIQSYYVIFRKDQTAKETVRFGDDGGSDADRMLIDRGGDDYPVAFQLICAHGVPLASLRDNPKAEPHEVNAAIGLLFAYATEMLRFYDLHHKRRGNNVIKTVIDQIQQFPPSELNVEEADLACV